VRNFVVKVRKALDLLEQKHGPFRVKCLLANDPDGDRNPYIVKWYIALTADWFGPLRLENLKYLLDNILVDFTPDDMAHFSSILAYHTSEKNLMTTKLESIQTAVEAGQYPNYVNEDFVLVEAHIHKPRLIIPLANKRSGIVYRTQTAKAAKKVVSDSTSKRLGGAGKSGNEEVKRKKVKR
jgi:hypothetical protein